MAISAEALRTLHRIHRQVGDLRDRLARGPRQIAAGEQSVLRNDQAYAAAKEAWKKTRIESDDQQVQLKQREAKVADLQRKLNECKSNVEFKTLKDQIAAENQANSVMEDEILDKLEKLEKLNADVESTEKVQAKAREELAKTKQRVEQQQAGLEAELARVTAELEQAEAQLNGDFKVDYYRIVKAHGEDALAAVEGSTCGGCFVMLTAQTINEMLKAKPIFCKSCGRLLYLPEDHVFS